MTSAAADVLEFWFGACGPDGAVDASRQKMWFGDARRYDAEIAGRFGALHQRAARGELEDWTATARGRLALIVVLDQLSRHIHRGAPAAFAQDPAAQALVTQGLKLNADRKLIPAERAFFYMPLEHAEDLALQRLGVRCFDGLARSVTDPWRKEYESFLDYAQRHLEVIRRFGRFPHRNAILGRKSTPREARFLRQPGSSF